MRKHLIFFCAKFLLVSTLNAQSTNDRITPLLVDSIVFDPTSDNPNFKLCNENIFQYFNDTKGLLYTGEKPALEKAFYKEYNPKKAAKETGLVRIRFVVNCYGESDRFRLLGMDNQYNEKRFHNSITKQLLTITKQLKGWGIKKIKGRPIDYYQYLIFVINNGKIVKILP